MTGIDFLIDGIGNPPLLYTSTMIEELNLIVTGQAPDEMAYFLKMK